MKRQVRICIFYGVILLLIVAVLWFMNASLERQKREVKLAEAGMEETEENLAINKELSVNYKYVLKVEDGQLSVYDRDQDTLYLDTGIQIDDLPQYVQIKITEGMGFDSEEELFAFLESYSS